MRPGASTRLGNRPEYNLILCHLAPKSISLEAVIGRGKSQMAQCTNGPLQLAKSHHVALFHSTNVLCFLGKITTMCTEPKWIRHGRHGHSCCGLALSGHLRGHPANTEITCSGPWFPELSRTTFPLDTFRPHHWPRHGELSRAVVCNHDLKAIPLRVPVLAITDPLHRNDFDVAL